MHVVPYKGVAVFHASDVGEPQALIFQAKSPIPGLASLKKVGADEWIRFNPSTGERQNDGSLLVVAKKPPAEYPWPSDRTLADILRAEKQYGIEYWKTFIS